jgi:prepilin-type N-terminal cleavage/methylation domain-containing protein
MKCSNRSSKGFTLIELMIVVVIIGILAAVTVPAYFNHILRSRQADAYHNLLDIKAAQEMVYSLENDYALNPNPNPLTPDALHTYSNTFTRMLSFNYQDIKYYTYYVTSSTGPVAFRSWAKGEHSKLTGSSIVITDTEDPCINPGTSTLKMSLGLEDCP